MSGQFTQYFIDIFHKPLRAIRRKVKMIFLQSCLMPFTFSSAKPLGGFPHFMSPFEYFLSVYTAMWAYISSGWCSSCVEHLFKQFMYVCLSVRLLVCLSVRTFPGSVSFRVSIQISWHFIKHSYLGKKQDTLTKLLVSEHYLEYWSFIHLIRGEYTGFEGLQKWCDFWPRWSNLAEKWMQSVFPTIICYNDHSIHFICCVYTG